MDVVKVMTDPSSYPLEVDEIEVRETHISWVFLAGDFAYKVKKPVNLGFLDFSTLEKRKMFCEREVKVNSLFSSIYLDVLPISEEGIGKGEPKEYCVRMKRMREEWLLKKMVDGLSKKPIGMIAGKLARHYESAEENPKGFGWVIENWEENFRQAKEMGARVDDIEREVWGFIEKNREMLKGRKYVRIHGDLHLGNIFYDGRDVEMFDAIEFNDRFGFGDPASDIAFLSMDLEFHGRKDLAAYLEELMAEHDKEMAELMGFYKSYRAFVRAKVALFRHAQTNDEKDLEEAERYFEFCSSIFP